MSSPATTLSITRTQHDQRPVLTLAGELDATTAPHLAATALEIVDEGARDVIVDASGLTHCDANGLVVCVQIAGRLRAQAGRFALVAPSPAVRRALDAGGLGATFVVAQTVAAALYAIHRDHP
jgi:anti-sigma B factor antagonist